MTSSQAWSFTRTGKGYHHSFVKLWPKSPSCPCVVLEPHNSRALWHIGTANQVPRHTKNPRDNPPRHRLCGGMKSLRRLLPKHRAPSFAEVTSPLDILANVNRRPERQLPPPTPAGKMRIHLFSGNFANANAAKHYCTYADGAGKIAFIAELPHASLDHRHIEACFGEYIERLDMLMPPEKAENTALKMITDNTLVIIHEAAFGGLGYLLHDTQRLKYHGPSVVDV